MVVVYIWRAFYKFKNIQIKVRTRNLWPRQVKQRNQRDTNLDSSGHIEHSNRMEAPNCVIPLMNMFYIELTFQQNLICLIMSSNEEDTSLTRWIVKSTQVQKMETKNPLSRQEFLYNIKAIFRSRKFILFDRFYSLIYKYIMIETLQHYLPFSTLLPLLFSHLTYPISPFCFGGFSFRGIFFIFLVDLRF